MMDYCGGNEDSDVKVCTARLLRIPFKYDYWTVVQGPDDIVFDGAG